LPEILAPLSAAEAESDVVKKRLAAAEKRGQGLRAAYECVVESLISATIKMANAEAEVANAEAEVANAEAERDHLSSQLADTEAKLRLTEEERDTLSSQLTNTRLQLEAVLQSSSWRITQPLRRVVRILVYRKQ
jgi:chromosome segregation ATPase